MANSNFKGLDLKRAATGIMVGLPFLLLSAVNVPLGIVSFITVFALFYLKRFLYASLLSLVFYIVAVMAFFGSAYSANPVMGLAYMAIAMLLPLLVYGLDFKIAVDTYSQFISPILGIGSLALMFVPFPGPALGLGYAVASSITSKREVFSIYYLPPLGFIIVYLTSALFTGTPIGMGLRHVVLSMQDLLLYAGALPSRPLYAVALIGSFILAMLSSFVVPKSLLVKREMRVRDAAVTTAGIGAVSTMALKPFFINPHTKIDVRRYMTTVRKFMGYLTHSRISIAMAVSALAGLVLSLPLGAWSLLALAVSSIGVLVGVYAAAYVSDLDTLKSLFSGILVDVPNEQELEQLFRENWLVLIGMDELKDRLVKTSMSFEDVPGVRPIHGILLYGPAGTGKTALGIGYAAWLAMNRGFNLFVVRAGRILRGGPYDAAHRLDLIFQLAEAYQPAVIYIDEIDALGRVRESPDAPTYLTTSVLLQDIDGIVSRYAKVLVIGTTNSKDVLDPALVRPGRLGDMLIYVDRPPKELVRKIILGIAEQKKVTIPNDLLDKASEVLETGADAESFVNCVALKEKLGLEGELPECLKAVSTGLPAY